VVARHEHYWDAGVLEVRQLHSPEQTGVVVTPIAIENVACQDYEIDFMIDGVLDQVLGRPACCSADFIDRRTVVSDQASERAIDVQIGGMKDLRHPNPSPRHAGSPEHSATVSNSPVVSVRGLVDAAITQSFSSAGTSCRASDQGGHRSSM